MTNSKIEGIKYIGSKQKLIPFIIKAIKEIGGKSVFDGFSGSVRVSQALAINGFRVVSNDISVASKNFALCYLSNHNNTKELKDAIVHLNNLKGVEGWYTDNYGGNNYSGSSIQPDGKKRIWQYHNTIKLDAIREEIDRLGFDEKSKSVMLTSLILALDKVDSTLGHQVSYLKDWSPRSFNVMKLELPKLFSNNFQHEIHCADTLDVCEKVDTDIAYYDPPYGSSNDKMPPSRVRYASYYHIWTSICLNDKPALFGAANRRQDSSDEFAASIFEEYRKNTNGKFIVIDAIEQLLKKTKSPYILLSYSTQGRATTKAIQELITDLNFSVNILEIDYKSNVMAKMSWTKDWLADEANLLKELIFVISKEGSDLKRFSKIVSDQKQLTLDYS